MFDFQFKFILSFFIIYLFVLLFKNTSKKIHTFLSGISKKAFFNNLSNEYKKFAILRIFFGLILLSRAINLFIYLPSYEIFSLIGLIILLDIVASILITFGFFSQWALIYLVLFMWQNGEKIIGTATLGNDVAAIVATFLFIVNSSNYLSVDSFLSRRYPKIRFLFIHFKFNLNPNDIRISKLSALIAYGGLCIYSVVWHISEPAWISGIAGPLLLSNNFMVIQYAFFEELFVSSQIAVILSKFLLFVMIFWYPVIIPFVLFGGIFKKFIIIWGVLFFILSLFILQLGSLAEIEFILWLILFWNNFGISKKKNLNIIYDDKCNLCDRTIGTITFVDIFNVTTLKPLSLNYNFMKNYNISKEDALADLHGVYCNSGQIYRGYDLYLELSKRIIFLLPLFPILYLGKLLLLGPLIYRKIAEQRIKLFGVCKIPTKKFVYENKLKFNSNFSVLNLTLFIHLLILFILFLIAIPIPTLNIKGINNYGAKMAHIYGIAPINVFNKTDLRMSENWYTITSNDFDEKIPIFDDDGTRLKYHKSDRLYFGNTLLFRRRVIGKNDECHFQSWKDSITYITSIYLDKKKVKGDYTFTYRQFYKPLPNYEDLEKNNKYEINKTEHICSVEYSVSN